jgi:hypothetical protein
MHREIADTSCDVGSAPSQLQDKFPQFAFAELGEQWWATDGHSGIHDESPSSIQQRIANFSEWLLRRPEQSIVVVGHSNFFRRWTQRPKMDNCASFSFELAVRAFLVQ